MLSKRRKKAKTNSRGSLQSGQRDTFWINTESERERRRRRGGELQDKQVEREGERDRCYMDRDVKCGSMKIRQYQKGPQTSPEGEDKIRDHGLKMSVCVGYWEVKPSLFRLVTVGSEPMTF